MKGLIYYISLPLIYFVSVLPFWLLYGVSDFLFVIIYHVIRYRRKVVADNLRNSFPERPAHEVKHIEREFYRYFCDLLVETLKSLTISPSTVRKRLSFTNIALLEQYYAQGKSIIIAMGHLGNWELAGARLAVAPLHKLYVIYRPFRNKYFNRLIYHMRTRLGNGLYPMKHAFREMVRNKDAVTATGFIADQTPSLERALWLNFLDQDTPFFTGMARIAKKISYPVVYVTIHRTRRGYYEIKLTDLARDPATIGTDTLVRLFAQHLEKDIRTQPEIWLWTHRRWKHRHPPAV